MKERKKLSCRLGLHSYKNVILLGMYDSKTEQIPAIFREKCRYCGKIRNEVRGHWLVPLERTEKDGIERFIGPETSIDGKVS